ncbi:hypothetical protein J4U01_gp111 [Mycobacterium phage Kumao]|uniref:Uncharacterized protein n=1 Tax=Mycobacterium phage Kumao TaxID=2041344 RepID=A0A2D1GPV3_9CAUD|nr:hypothetical protein J4U01_gp111 [Mycobacterium phage Kumao]ATN94047.1 hypothetical protein SEA_KUMAO_85 [Mycobacterium phage Kumao]
MKGEDVDRLAKRVLAVLTVACVFFGGIILSAQIAEASPKLPSFCENHGVGTGQIYKAACAEGTSKDGKRGDKVAANEVF